MADGKGCVCHAYGECECACGADWTPQEVYDLRAEVERLQKENEYLRRENRRYHALGRISATPQPKTIVSHETTDKG